tara:strand:- start:226 stop:657 length:432 start_codon:yes stop_codon:yes gene_type:complete
MTPKIIKLTNGDEIITTFSKDDSDTALTVIVENPLKINSYPRISKKGVEESMALSRWTSYGENEACQLIKNNIVAIADASLGIAKFYEFCVLKMKTGQMMKGLGMSEPTDEQLKELEEEFMNELEELEEIDYDDKDKPKRTLH